MRKPDMRSHRAPESGRSRFFVLVSSSSMLCLIFVKRNYHALFPDNQFEINYDPFDLRLENIHPFSRPQRSQPSLGVRFCQPGQDVTGLFRIEIQFDQLTKGLQREHDFASTRETADAP